MVKIYDDSAGELILKFKEYIRNLDIPGDFCGTEADSGVYLDILEKSLFSYSIEEIESMSALDDLHTYARIVCVIAVLLSNMRILEYKKLWEEMMSDACHAAVKLKKRAALDFSVKELLLAYMAMEKNVCGELTGLWRSCLCEIEPYGYYFYNSGKNHNINIYNLAGEWLRDINNMTDSTDYFASCWPLQLEKFDENGMYADNFPEKRNPVLYDLTTRTQIQLIIGNGYNGEFAGDLNKVLEKGGYMTLFTQSASFELPYGGRSNQYLFNEGLIAANCEYEALRHKSLGDMRTAGAFKRAASGAISSIERWLVAGKHIKNFYENEHIGTESYGYFNKYMITLGSFLAIGYLFADDSIKEFPCPAETGGFVFETTDNFNKIFANCAGYSIEIDTNPDFNYDCAGLGRIHKRGIPTELGLSMPFTKTPKYMLPETGENLSIGPGWDKGNGEKQYLSSCEDLVHSLEVVKESRNHTIFSVFYNSQSFEGIDGIKETYSIDENGIEITSALINPIVDCVYFRVPVLHRNGDSPKAETTTICLQKNSAEVVMGEFRYDIRAEGDLSIDGGRYFNRNGEYGALEIVKSGSFLRILLSLS